ncbi:MAG: 50S ribosomal protein L9 [Candidatus Dadabacteria bacterium]|nr:MAG: 50S ribosomal protein L9 [Candidatus Dadabacteria bacterium]
MKLILIEAVEHLGLPGDVVDVRTGYARNYLLPKRKALKATPDNVAAFEHQKHIAEARRKRVIDNLRVRCETLDGAEVHFEENVTETGRLYGSVSARRIIEALEAQFGPIQHNWLRLAEPIREPGEYTVELRLAPELTASVKVVVEGVGAPEPEPEAEAGEDEASGEGVEAAEQGDGAEADAEATTEDTSDES